MFMEKMAYNMYHSENCLLENFLLFQNNIFSNFSETLPTIP